MAPYGLIFSPSDASAGSTLQTLSSRAAEPQVSLTNQWRHPNDIFSILLLLGPDIIQRSLAQLAGTVLTPICFSFGWVAYAANALLSAVGDGRMMPPADYAALVIGAKSGHIRSNKAWIIGRLLRDFEYRVSKDCSCSIEKGAPGYEALRITVFRVLQSQRSGTPTRDWAWYSGLPVIILQLVVAMIPWILDQDWSVMLFTIAGTVLALLHGSLAQWKAEKWACPKKGGWTVSITQGNGSKHVMVILGNRHGLDLEILATGSGMFIPPPHQRLATVSLAAAWIALLISVVGLSQNTWYLLGVGLIGMAHNVTIAGLPRDPSAFGVHLEEVMSISDDRVVKVLQRTEDKFPLVGSSLVPVFFPGGLRILQEEDEFWGAAQALRRSTGLDKLNISIDTSSTETSIFSTSTTTDVSSSGKTA